MADYLPIKIDGGLQKDFDVIDGFQGGHVINIANLKPDFDARAAKVASSQVLAFPIHGECQRVDI
jgi:hypothetical protein